MDLFKLGQITSPVGIKGEVRVFPYTREADELLDFDQVLIDGEKEYHQIEKARVDKNTVVVKLSGIDDRNAAEALRSKYLVIPKDEYDLDEDTYFIDDLIGLSVYDENNVFIGVLNSVDQNSPQDKYVIKTDKSSFMLPAVKEFILSVDIENKKMTVHLVEGIMDL